jgi:hypothetical protein
MSNAESAMWQSEGYSPAGKYKNTFGAIPVISLISHCMVRMVWEGHRWTGRHMWAMPRGDGYIMIADNTLIAIESWKNWKEMADRSTVGSRRILKQRLTFQPFVLQAYNGQRMT